MSKLEKFGLTTIILTVLMLFGTTGYATFDYWTKIRPVVLKFSEPVLNVKQENGTTKQLSRLDFIDLLLTNAVQSQEKK